MNDTRLRLLLNEDNDGDAARILEGLGSFGFDVEFQQIDTREELVRALQRGEWDLIISGHSNANLSSTDALYLLLTQGYDIPLIIVSGTIGEEAAVAAIKAGAYDYVRKDNLKRLGPAVLNARETWQSRQARQRVEEEIHQSRQQLRELASHLERIREEERAIIARDVHDDLGAALMALKLDIGWLRRRLGGEGEINTKLETMGKLVDDSIHAMRRIITELRPSVLDDIGLVAAIEWQLSAFAARTGLECHFDHQSEALHLVNKADEVAIFRIFQESLTNILRHAQASRVDVSLEQHDGNLLLTIRDDGRGISEEALQKQGSFGILGIHERALQMGGSARVERGKPGGTVVSLTVPLQ